MEPAYGTAARRDPAACVDGDAAKPLDHLLKSLEDERKQWEKDFQAHLDTFQWSITLKPQEEKFNVKYELRYVVLHVGNVPLEPDAIGLMPVPAKARITKDQAAKIVAVLAKDNFFRDSVADANWLTPPQGPHADTWARYGSDAVGSA